MKFLLSFSACLLFTGCQTSEENIHTHAIGFAPKNSVLIINSHFTPCDSNITYYYYNKNKAEDKAASFKGGSSAMKRKIRKHFPSLNLGTANGMFTIHFVLNCKGEIDWFTFSENDLDYQPIQFSKAIRSQLIEIQKSLNGWQPIFINGSYHDCFMHTTYKIKNGNIIEILP